MKFFFFYICIYRLHIYGPLLGGFRAECENVERVFVEHLWTKKTSFVFTGFLTFSSFITKLKKKKICPLSFEMSCQSSN